ncbi:glycosyhydrolase [Methylohalobius crimeensis]|uniref:glycosyhydrolase n=1 Tax=Methylohalobius crimeensis TaxID=244365 RepID=UPI0003B7787B|nr:glycosyhydrolase [Methylohalobius crimeensis]
MGLRGRFHAARAPVLKYPVLIIESDDWGPGSDEQSHALEAIRAVLVKHRDKTDRHPVMTIGVLLSIPDAEAIVASDRYHFRSLQESRYRSIVETLMAGEREGVFDLQLHGMAHFWPANFMAARNREKAVASWLSEDGWRTERLPAWLQSRWIDAASLPSRSLPVDQIRSAVREEVECFEHCFGRRPQVVVPPTFVWDAQVEKIYADAGIKVLITPGRRYAGRDREGRLTAPERSFFDGELLSCGLRALVRDVYFEPSLGHRSDQIFEAIARKWRRGQPALLETHRFNFLDGQLNSSLDALEALLEGALTRFPDIRFMSSYQLATGITDFPSVSPLHRIRTAWRRLRS